MSVRLPPLNALHAFVVAARHLNLTRAADELCVTQGAVSRQIASLEQHIGMKLFYREARGLKLTVQGESLLPELRAAFDLIQKAADKAAKSHHVIRLKAPTCAMRWLLPKLMIWEKSQPDIPVELTTTSAHDVDFLHEPFDAAVLFGRDTSRYAQCHKLFDEVLVPICAPSLTTQTELNPTEILRYTLLHPTRDQRDWYLWLTTVGSQTTQANRNQQFDTMDLAISAAIQGFGIAVGDATLVAGDVQSGLLRIPHPHQIATGDGYYFTVNTNKPQSTALKAFADWLLAESVS
ncbi:LysR family transcriptional regulator [Leeia sp. TBRC 13508]|uniref:LysR family transcriptional regulator n=1 Tax=Leeia speluncae TaxID=2884804 RepID=A0ABS8D784_9NEIS|nr:LysR substrate-binding domain-containing protein [Leeia speluncae]MCB6184042.1 LysR family transcriptional regulator [Leeia speluncae]